MYFPHLPFLIIISSPSGAGKSTVCRMLTENDQHIKLSISATTRQKRPKEIEGQDYFFLSQSEYDQMRDRDEFLEYAQIFGNHYGTPRKMVENELNRGNDVLFDIDWQGARQLSQKFKQDDIITIFILPPSLQELYRRLQNRAQDSEEVVLNRMRKAKDEVSHYNEYDYVLVNDDLMITYQKVQHIISAARIKRADRNRAADFVTKLLSN